MFCFYSYCLLFIIYMLLLYCIICGKFKKYVNKKVNKNNFIIYKKYLNIVQKFHILYILTEFLRSIYRFYLELYNYMVTNIIFNTPRHSCYAFIN